MFYRTCVLTADCSQECETTVLTDWYVINPQLGTKILLAHH